MTTPQDMKTLVERLRKHADFAERQALTAPLRLLREAADALEAQDFIAVGWVTMFNGCTSTKYEPGRLPDGHRMLYISKPSGER